MQTQTLKFVHVECPVCGAAIGERCRTISHEEMPAPHFKRKLAALTKPPGAALDKPSHTVRDDEVA